MEIDTSLGYSKISNTIYRKEANLTAKEMGLLSYLMSHKEGFKLSLRRIAKDTHIHFNTVKKILNELKSKGYSEAVNKVLLNYNKGVSDVKHFVQKARNINALDVSSKKICSNESASILKQRCFNSEAGVLQFCSTKNNNKNNKLELIKAKNNFLTLSYEAVDDRTYGTLPQKKLPVFVASANKQKQDTEKADLNPLFKYSKEPLKQDKYQSIAADQPIILKQELKEHNGNIVMPLETATKVTNKPSVSRQKLSTNQTSASELPLIIPLEFVEIGKTINQYLDLSNEYELFRANKIQKQHTNSNWLNAWKSWLEHGVKKYGKNQQSFLLTHKEQKMDSAAKPLIEITEEEKETKLQKLKELAENYYKKEQQYSDEAFNLKMQSHNMKDPIQRLALRSKASEIEWQVVNENKKMQQEFIRLSAGLNLINCNDFDTYYNNFKTKLYKTNAC